MSPVAEDVRQEVSRAMKDDESLLEAFRMQLERLREFLLGPRQHGN